MEMLAGLGWAVWAGWNLRNRHGPGRPTMAAWLLPAEEGRLLTMFILLLLGEKGGWGDGGMGRVCSFPVVCV